MREPAPETSRQLGRIGPRVHAIGLGCMPMSGIYGPASEDESIAAIHRALDVGITLLDTADVYGDGHNERLVGRAIQGRRDDVVLATKFGHVRAPAGHPTIIDGRPEHVRAACDASLLRLGVDAIDLYQQHRVDPRIPIEETIGAVAGLVTAGKVRYIGLSEARPEDIRRAAAVHPIATLQNEYSLIERSNEGEVIDTCEELGIGLLAFAPLGRGLLAGALTAGRVLDPTDARSKADRFPRVGPGHRSANLAVAEVVQSIAAQSGASAAQVSLAWLLSRQPWIVPIPGARRASSVEQNAQAAALRLTHDELAALDELAGMVVGERYGAAIRNPSWISPRPRTDPETAGSR